MSTRRVQKVSELVLQLLSEKVSSDYSENYGLITISAVNLSEDLKDATVYISLFEKSKQEKLLNELASKANEYQHMLGRQLKMKYTPKLMFQADDALGEVNRIEQLLESIKKK